MSGSYVPGSQVPRPRFPVPESQGSKSQGPRASGLRVPGPGSQVLILDYNRNFTRAKFLGGDNLDELQYENSLNDQLKTLHTHS